MKKFLLSLCLLPLLASAHDYTLGKIKVLHPIAKPTLAVQRNGSAYLGLENSGDADKLLSASTPAAKAVEIHEMKMSGDVMQMREIGHLDLPTGAKIMMQPGHGQHLMLIGLKKALKVGDQLPLTLQFEKAGKLEVMLHVEDDKKK